MGASTDAAIVSAAVAVLGYFGKLTVEALVRWTDRRTERLAQLIELQSLLLASRSVFKVQRSLASKLCNDIQDKIPAAYRGGGFDDMLATAHKLDLFSEDQRYTHGLIRAYTENALLKINTSMLEWLAKDKFHKSAGDELGAALRRLEAHLILWRAKYEFWIPDRPERTLVFLADERDDGIGFPTGIEELVIQRTGGIIPAESATAKS